MKLFIIERLSYNQAIELIEELESANIFGSLTRGGVVIYTYDYKLSEIMELIK